MDEPKLIARDVEHDGLMWDRVYEYPDGTIEYRRSMRVHMFNDWDNPHDADHVLRERETSRLHAVTNLPSAADRDCRGA